VTEITAPAGFFWDNAVSPTTATDLLTAVAEAEANVDNALQSAIDAAASATAAASSALTAMGSQTAAATSETNAATSASTAATSATASAGSATAAASSQTAASSSATAAAGSATTAASSATNAANSATNAANSATNAATSATAAASSATTASNAAATIPGPLVGRALNFIRINASGNAYEVQTPAQAAADLGALNDYGRNKLHNALFNIPQRGNGPFTSAGMTLDRWGLALTTDSNSVTRASLNDTDRSQIGDEEALSALQNTFTGTSGATALSAVYQRIENARRLAGKSVTISFYAKAASGTPKVGISLDQNWGTGGSPSAAVNGSGASVTISSTWARYNVTISVGSSSGKTFGTNGDDYTQLNLWFSTGSASQARSGAIGVQSGTISFYGVQLEVGNVVTALEKSDPQIDLAKCQRFYATAAFSMALYANTGAATWQIFTHPVPMRATPTANTAGGASINTSSFTLTATGVDTTAIGFTVTSTGVASWASTLILSADL